MKARTMFLGLMLLPLLCAVAIPARAQTTNADFQQAVAAYQQSPSDATAEKVIRMAAAMNQLPPIPEEARRHFVRGATLFKDAKAPDDYKQVVYEFEQAVIIAPWWPDARYNFALAQEAVGEYDLAIGNLKEYLLFKLSSADARAAQDKIYALEAEQEKAAKVKAAESSPHPAAAPQKLSFADLLKKIDGKRFIWEDPSGRVANALEFNGNHVVKSGACYDGGCGPGLTSGVWVRTAETSVYGPRFQFPGAMCGNVYNERPVPPYEISEDGESVTVPDCLGRTMIYRLTR